MYGTRFCIPMSTDKNIIVAYKLVTKAASMGFSHLVEFSSYFFFINTFSFEQS